MTGSVQEKKMRSGMTYLYVVLSYKDPITQKWKQKQINTGLTKGNKKKAESLIPDLISRYDYLEKNHLIVNSIDPEIIFCDYIEKWLENKKQDIEIDTYEAYTSRVQAIVRYFDASKIKIKDMTSYMIDQYLKYELSYGKTNQKTKEKGPLSVRTVRSRKSILSAVFDQACIDGLVKHNIVTPVKVSGKKDKDFEEELLFLTEEEVVKLLEFLSKNYPRLMPIAFVAVYFGLRRSEILGLHWSSIDLEKRIITIKNTVVKVNEIHEKEDVKTINSNRSLYLFDNALKCFEQVKKEQKFYQEFFCAEYKATSDYVFTKEDGSCYDPDLLSKQFKKATSAFGRKEITLHKLRHSCASMAIERGWSIKQLQYWLGHSDIQTTMNIYAHYNKQKLNSTNNDLNDMSRGVVHLFD